MKAATIHGYGENFDTLRYEDVQTPTARPGELVIKVHASGVNHCDTDLRKGLFGVESPMPHVMGVDAAGEIVEVGTGVTQFKAGDRVAPHFMLSCGVCHVCIDGRENLCPNADVLGVTVWGGYAEYVKVGQNHVVRLPDALSYDDAVAGQIPFATAWEALIEVAKIRAGETVLVTAAGGGVGSAGVQIAKLAGARVIAAAGSGEKLEKARELGADETINYTAQNIGEEARRLTGGQGVDAALEMTGGTILVQSIDALASGARLATIGAHGGEQVELDFVEFFRKHISVHGCGRSTKAQVERVLRLMAAGTLKPVIHRTFGLNEAAAAHEMMESRNFFGRMIMRP
jgi:NADPH:quinone reductase-like Zn-dependent oxidoreductase